MPAPPRCAMPPPPKCPIPPPPIWPIPPPPIWPPPPPCPPPPPPPRANAGADAVAVASATAASAERNNFRSIDVSSHLNCMQPGAFNVIESPQAFAWCRTARPRPAFGDQSTAHLVTIGGNSVGLRFSGCERTVIESAGSLRVRTAGEALSKSGKSQQCEERDLVAKFRSRLPEPPPGAR